MATDVTSKRRTLHYATLAQFLSDAESLASGRYTTVGNWTFPQILRHLAETVRCSLDGFPFRAAWFIRWSAPFLKNSFLTKPMRSGFKLPANAHVLLPPPDEQLEPALDNLREQIARFNESVDVAPHPVFGKLTHEEFASLHLRHAEMHMSFVIPLHEDAAEGE